MYEEEQRNTWYYKPANGAHEEAYTAGIRCITRDGRRARFRKMHKLARGGSFDAPSEHSVVKSAINTLVAKIGKSEVMPVARAVGIRRTRQERAKMLSHWLRGQIMSLGVHRLARLALRDACTYGTGALHPFRGLDDRPTVERVWIGDLGVEESEEDNGDVRTLYRAMVIDRAVAMRAWPKMKPALRTAEYAFANDGKRTVIGAPITVVECWRLTTGGIVGRHVICASTCTLRDEPWDSKKFPIKLLRFYDDTAQFFGVGLAEDMAGEQAMIDAITEKIEEHFDQGGTRIIVDTAGEVQTEKLDNTPYGLIKYTSTAGGQPPQVVSPPAVSSDYRMHQETLMSRTYSMHGVSELSAQSRKPPGLNAAVALDTYNDIESERFYHQTKDFELLMVQTGEGLIDVAENIADDPELKDKAKADVLCVTESEARMIRFNDARIPSDQRSLEVEPVSQFSATLSGRIQQADTLRQLGIIKNEDQAMEVLNDPNLRKFRSTASAARYVVEVQVERCLSGRRQVPDPTMPLDYALEHAVQMLHVAILESGDDDDDDPELEEGMATLRDYISDVHTLIEQRDAPAQAMGAPAPEPAPDQMGGEMQPPMAQQMQELMTTPAM